MPTRLVALLAVIAVFAIPSVPTAVAQGPASVARRARPPATGADAAATDPATTAAADPAVEPDEGLPPIAPADYGQWESLRRRVLSPDGRWLAYEIARANEKNELRLRMLATDSLEVVERGARPAFSNDGAWLAYMIEPTEAEREKARSSGSPAPSRMALRSLVDGEVTEIENVASFDFADAGGHLVVRRPKPPKQSHDGVDIVVRDLANGRNTAFGNVATYAWNDDGTLLALVIDTADDVGNGIQLYDAAAGSLRTLDSADTGYAGLGWRDDHDDLAVMRVTPHDAKQREQPSHVLLAWKDAGRPDPGRHAYDHREDEGFPEAMRVVDSAGLRWSDDGAALFFGIAEWERPPDDDDDDENGDGEENGDDDDENDGDAEDDDRDAAKRDGADRTPDARRGEKDAEGASLRETLKEPSNVEVWHAEDVEIIPRQQRNAARGRRESDLCAWWLDDAAFVRLGDDSMESVRPLESQERAIGFDNTPHERLRMFGPMLYDLYEIDTRTGERNRVLGSVKYVRTECPTGRYLLFVRDDDLWSFDLETDSAVNLTGDLEHAFINEDVSSLTDEKPMYGLAAWTEDGRHVVAYDRYDLWMLAADGSRTKRLTRGRQDKIRHRRVVLDPEADEFVSADRPIYLSIFGERSKRSGYARLDLDGAVERLRWQAGRVSGLQKADDAQVYCWVEQRFDDSPDVFVAGPDLANPAQRTETNPFQAEYAWGRAELIEYESDGGEPLQGALFYPAGYEPGKTYPMIVYIYERLSDTLHGYTAPSERSPYNTAVFTSQGYFVLRPDIVYRPQNPGISAVECVVPAVRTVLETGMIDPERVGLIGHSWGAYQTAFIVTQTDLFAAGVAGAPLTNMMSMSMSIYWNSGETNAWIFHESQGRMDRPFWKDIDTYIRNSPIFNIETLSTPLLLAFGTEDGAVDFNQGVEMYNAARLAEKQLVMLVYPGENHGLRQKPNQVDYHYRVLEWFAHYLKGEPAEPWILEGVDELDRRKELEALEAERGSGRGGGRRGGPR